jgi:hypothetical protein
LFIDTLPKFHLRCTAMLELMKKVLCCLFASALTSSAEFKLRVENFTDDVDARHGRQDVFGLPLYVPMWVRMGLHKTT